MCTCDECRPSMLGARQSSWRHASRWVLTRPRPGTEGRLDQKQLQQTSAVEPAAWQMHFQAVGLRSAACAAPMNPSLRPASLLPAASAAPDRARRVVSAIRGHVPLASPAACARWARDSLQGRVWHGRAVLPGPCATPQCLAPYPICI